MNPLLLTFSLLLLSLPSFGHDKEEHLLYEWETSSGIKWKIIGDDNFHRKYKGEIKDGKPNGVGFLMKKISNDYIYVGEWLNGMFHGKGKHFINNDVYEGDFKKGKYDGVGNLLEGNGNSYKGEWEDGKRNGRGLSESYSSQFDGYWENNQFIKGKLTWNSNRYVYGRNLKIDNGIIPNEEKEKEENCKKMKVKTPLCLLLIDGRSYSYDGEFKDMKEHGQGIFHDYYGNKYVGYFKNGDFWNIKLFDINGKLRKKWIKGKKIKIVD